MGDKEEKEEELPSLVAAIHEGEIIIALTCGGMVCRQTEVNWGKLW